MIQNVCLAVLAALMLQAEMGSMQGTVTDEAGNPIEGVVLRLKDVSRGGEHEFKTNKKGYFYRRGLRASSYELTIEKEGYETVQSELRLKAGEELRANFQLVSATSPPEAAFERGVAAFKEGDIEAAAAAFEEVVKLAPDSPEGHTNLGLAYMQLSRLDDAIRELEKAASLAPESFRTWMQLGGAYAQAQKLDRAVEAFEKGLAQEHDPADPMALEGHLGLGLLYFAEGKVPEAIESYQEALALDPNSPEALLGLGKCYFNTGEYEQAREHLERVVSLAPDSPQAAEAKTYLAEIEKLQEQ